MKRTEERDLRQRRYVKTGKRDGIEESFIDNTASARKYEAGQLPVSYGYALIVLFLILIKIFHAFENSLPDQVKIRDAGAHSDRFIGERAELQLKRLTDLGTRVVGSYENEVLAVDFLKREISFISQEANKIHMIEIDIQKPVGSYFLTFKPHGFRNSYSNIQNVVVKLSSGNSNNSVLMNCHYDTVPESPGASDNGLNCVVMLEILRVLATSSTPLKHNVIFLFNGAEENPLQASHGFLSQHKWKKEVKVLINLDSAGAGGREVLFQTSGEPWLVEAYARVVPRPTAGVQAEELFHYGVIPSDTDFRVFRDFAGYPGFDIAHCSNGYIYHTKLDKMDYIRPGVYQNTGDNLLALVRELVNSSELEISHSKTRIVYFDVFTFFMIVYTEEMSFLINFATVFLSVFSVFKTLTSLTDAKQGFWKRLWISVGGQLLGLFLAAAVVFFTSKTLDFYKSTMSWYLRPVLIVPLYCFPIVIAMVAILLLTQTYLKRDLPGRKVIYFINGAQLIWTIVLLLGTLKGIRTSFIIMLVVLFPSVGSLFVTFLQKSYSVKTYLLTHMFCLVFPILFVLNQSVRIFTVIIPMTARMGPHTNPELVIGGLTILLSTICLSQIVPTLLLMKKLRNFLICLCLIHILAMVGVIGTKYGFPYSGNIQNPSFQRFYVLHSDRTFHDARGEMRKADSGIFIQSLDRNNVNYVAEFIPELKQARVAREDCSTELLCGFPVFHSRFIRPAPYSYWIPASPPTIHHPTSLKVVNQTQVLVNVRKIRLAVTGPDHITVGLSPRKGVELIGWSFEEGPPRELDTWEDRKTYMVYYSYGVMGGTLEFDIDLQMNQTHSSQIVDIAVIGHYMHDKKFRTNEFEKIISKFPEWAHVTPWTTTYKSWVI